jgi:hypothetical protein
MMILHNEHKNILKQKVMIDDVFGRVMIEEVISMVQLVNDMERDSSNRKKMNESKGMEINSYSIGNTCLNSNGFCFYFSKST